MIWIWLLQAASIFVVGLLSLIEVPVLAYPDALSVVVPVPFAPPWFLAAVDYWLGVSLACLLGLVIGKVALFVYRLIPLNG
jgi:hypothetical protein